MTNSPEWPVNGVLGHAAHRDAQAFFPHRALLLGVDHEPAELGLRRRLAGAEVGPAVADEVEHRDALGDTRGMVERRRRLHDAVAETDVLRALRRGREEHLGRARVRVLLEEVVLDLPRVVDADRVGVLDLLERVLDQPVLGVLGPRSRELVLVEDAELHADALRARAECVEAFEDVVAARVVRRARARSRRSPACMKFVAVRAERLLERRVPHRADDFGAGDLLARLADERAVAHLGERRAQVVDVRRLVGLDAADELAPPRRRRRRGRSSDSTASAHANVWNAETSMNSRPTMRRSIISSERSRSGKRAHRFGVARASASGVGGLPSAGDDPHADRASVCVMSSVTGCSNATSRAANHICLWPPSSSQPASSRACASNKPDCRCAIAVPVDALVEVRLHVVDRDRADHRAEAFDGADARRAPRSSAPGRPRASRYFVCATFGNTSGHSSSGASRISVPNCSRCDCCHASIAGTRYFVRGETYAPSAVNPP